MAGNLMSEEILKVELAELLSGVRFKRPNGTVLEAPEVEAIRDCCVELRNVDSAAADDLIKFFNLAAKITGERFPVKVEFAVTLK